MALRALRAAGAVTDVEPRLELRLNPDRELRVRQRDQGAMGV
eukprot:gene53126-10459_t